MAMALLGILLTAGVGMLVQTTSVAAQNLRRTTAANLLTRQLELARGARPADLAEGITTSPAMVGGTTYTVTQETRYVSSSDGASLCDGGSGSLLYKLVTVRVTWPDMQAVAPVRGDTLRALGVGTDAASNALGVLAVRVVDVAGNPVAAASVGIFPTGTTKTTDSSGCVVFLGLPPAGYETWASSPGSTASGYAPARTVPAGSVTQVSVTLHPPTPPAPPATPTPAASPTVTPEPVPSTDGPGAGTPTTTPTSSGDGDTPPFGGDPDPGDTPPAPDPEPTTTAPEPVPTSRPTPWQAS